MTTHNTPPVLRRPGQRRRADNDLATFITALDQHPGQWAPYPRTYSTPESAAVAASRIRTGQFTAFGPGYEAETSGPHMWVRRTR